MSNNFEYIRTNFYLVWRRLLEYKANMISALLSQFSYYLVMTIMYFTLYQNFGNIIEWKFTDFWIFFLTFDCLRVIITSFTREKLISQLRQRGEFNSLLFRSKNIFLSYVIHNPRSANYFYLAIDVPFLILCLILFSNLNIYTSIISILTFLMILIYSLITTFMFTSFGFLFNKFDYSFVNLFVERINGDIEDFPAPFFQNDFIRKILIFFPCFLLGSLLIPIIQNYSIWNLKLQLIFISITSIISIIITIVNWKYGLKNYEAYN